LGNTIIGKKEKKAKKGSKGREKGEANFDIGY